LEVVEMHISRNDEKSYAQKYWRWNQY
jgi:hypothetical protein